MSEKLLKLDEVIEQTRRSRASIYRDMDAGRFPRPKNLGPNRKHGGVAWLQSDIDSWMAGLTYTDDRQ